MQKFMKQKELKFVNGTKIFNPSIFSNKRFISELFVSKIVDELEKWKEIKKAVRNAYFPLYNNISEVYGELNNVRCLYRMLHDETMISHPNNYNASYKKNTLFVLPKNTFINAENDDIIYSKQVEYFGDFHTKFDKELFSIRAKYFDNSIYDKETIAETNKINETLLTFDSEVDMIDFSKIESTYNNLSEKKDVKSLLSNFMNCLEYSQTTFSKLLEHYLPYTMFENTISNLDDYDDSFYGFENYIVSWINEANGKKIMYLKDKVFFNSLSYGKENKNISIEANLNSIAYASTTRDNPFFAGDLFLTFLPKDIKDKKVSLDKVYKKNTELVEKGLQLKIDFINIFLKTFKDINVNNFSELWEFLIKKGSEIKNFKEYFILDSVRESFDDSLKEVFVLMDYYKNELTKVVKNKDYFSEGIAILDKGIKSFIVSQLYNTENSKGFFEGANFWISYFLETNEGKSFFKDITNFAFEKQNLKVLPEEIVKIIELDKAENTFVNGTCNSLKMFKNILFNNRFNMDDFSFIGASILDLINNYYSYMFVMDIDNLKDYNKNYKMRRKFSIMNDFKKYYAKIYYANNSKEKYIMSYNNEHDGIVELTVVAKTNEEVYTTVTNAIKEKFRRLYYLFNNEYLEDFDFNLLTNASYTNEW